MTAHTADVTAHTEAATACIAAATAHMRPFLLENARTPYRLLNIFSDSPGVLWIAPDRRRICAPFFGKNEQHALRDYLDRHATAHTEAVRVHTEALTAHKVSVTAHIVSLTTHIKAATAHMEAVTAYTHHFEPTTTTHEKKFQK